MPAVGKVVAGAAMITAAALMEYFSWGTGTPVAMMLASAGTSLMMGGIAQMLTRQPGSSGVACKNPIAPWNYIYGSQGIGGTIIFETTNNSQGVSSNKQLHRVIVLACHPCQVGTPSSPGSFPTGFELRVDGQAVPLALSGAIDGGWAFDSYSPGQASSEILTAQRTGGVVTITLLRALPANVNGNNVMVSGMPDNTMNGNWRFTDVTPSTATPHTVFTYACGGADTSLETFTVLVPKAQTTYPDYGNKIHVEVQNGTHTTSFPGLLASATGWEWGGTNLCLGRTVAYVRMGYAQPPFSGGIPQISFVLQGKNDILDPRTGTRGYTANAALVAADYMSLPRQAGGFGLSIGSSIPTAQLIAAANICDEAVFVAAGGTQPRYTCNTVVSLSEPRGNVLAHMMASMAGRLSYQGGLYSIFPGAWVGSTLTLGPDDLVGPVKWMPNLSISEICNAVKGTYISPGNAYQPADIPPYMQDALHGYTSDQWLAMDGGERIFEEMQFSCTDNAPMAQRLAKIQLLRKRFQGRGTLRCKMTAYSAVAVDVIALNYPRFGWSGKLLEVLSSRLMIEEQNGAPTLVVELDVAETDPSIYEWSTTEELTAQDTASVAYSQTNWCPIPEAVSMYSGPGETVGGVTYPSTVTTDASGISHGSIYIQWTTPNDGYVTSGGHIEVQWQKVSDAHWTALGSFSPTVNSCYIPNVTDGVQYNCRVRAVNVANVPSDWVESGPVTAAVTLSLLAYSGVQVAPDGTLGAYAMPTGGTAVIEVPNFTATIGSNSAACVPTTNTLTGLAQGQKYYVYYVDLTFAGGSITPIATQNTADFENQQGHFLIGSILTPLVGSTGSSTYSPFTYADVGTQATSYPANAFDGDLGTIADVSSSASAYSTATVGDCIWATFPSISLSRSTTLTVVVQAVNIINGGTGSGTATIVANINGTLTTLLNTTSSVGATTYTATVPSGVNFNTISVEATATATHPGSGGGIASVHIQPAEIYIQS